LRFLSYAWTRRGRNLGLGQGYASTSAAITNSVSLGCGSAVGVEPANCPVTRKHLGVTAILALVAAYAVMVQGPGWNQNAHYSLVRALANGTPTIDATRFETGPWYVTGDVTLYRGHYYAAKAPGLAFASLPEYLWMKTIGAWNSGDSTRMLWFLGLWTVILPVGILLFLVQKIGDRLQPGTGTMVAVTLGVGTLVLPFSTLFFAHLLSATLGFAAFAVLWREREGSGRPARLATAGLLAGLATTTEYPLAILATLLAIYAISRPPLLQRGAAYAIGSFVGVTPLFLYQWWAFGSPTHFAYENVVGGLNATGTFGVHVPSFRVAMELLFSSVGLLRLSPVLALAVVGVVLLYRSGRKSEALLIAGIGAAYLVYNSGYETPFGGHSPGPRFLIVILPFLAVALCPVFAVRPITTLALAAPSAVLMLAVTATHPMENWDGHWFDRLGDANFSATVTSFFGSGRLDSLDLPSSTHWYFLILLLAPIALAVGLALAELPRRVASWPDGLSAAGCLIGWLVVQRQAPSFLSGHGVARGWAPLVVLLLAVAVGVFALSLPAVVRSAIGQPGEKESASA
jgi:hypothetical protein